MYIVDAIFVMVKIFRSSKQLFTKIMTISKKARLLLQIMIFVVAEVQMNFRNPVFISCQGNSTGKLSKLWRRLFRIPLL